MADPLTPPSTPVRADRPTLDWRPGGGGGDGSFLAFTEDRLLVGQVVRYDKPPRWRGFVRGHAVGPSKATRWAAQEAVADALEAERDLDPF